MEGRRNILVVDDNEGIRNTLSMILRRKGFEVTCAPDGPKAMEAVHTNHFDSMLLDMILPGMDGVEVNRQVQSMSGHPRVMMMTGYADDGKIKTAIEAGAEKVFFKPLDLDAVIRWIQGA